ncbi:uncharacterized protein EI90DRAFT_3091245, partial [Cantharellus anzutake]|uniref:uncharacterized protein n=1 Tax=Cantharellus anzutake TaxID=1750568 RepID=UPI0019069486
DLMDIILSLLLLLCQVGVLRSSGGRFCPLYLGYSAEAPVPILLISTNRGPLILSPLRSIRHPLIYHHLPSLIQCPANTSSIATLRRPTHNQDVQVWTQIFRRQWVKRRHLRTFLLVTERKQSSPPQGSSSKLLPLLLSSSLLRISIRYQVFS